MNIMNVFPLMAVAVSSCTFGVYDNSDSDGYAAANGWTIMHLEDLSVNYNSQFVNYMQSNAQKILVINSWKEGDCAIAYGDDDGTNEWITINGIVLTLSAGCNVQLYQGDEWYIRSFFGSAISWDGSEAWGVHPNCCGNSLNKSPAIYSKGCDSSGITTSAPINTVPATSSPPHSMCCTNAGDFKRRRKQKKYDKQCSQQQSHSDCSAITVKGVSTCTYIPCMAVFEDEYGEYWVKSDNVVDESTFMNVAGAAVLRHVAEENNNIWMYLLLLLVCIFGGIIYVTMTKCNLCSEYKKLKEPEAITPLIGNNAI